MDFNVPQRTLTDIRDGETYRVRKLADGNVWMTENLRKSFTAGEVLTPATTDVTANTTVTLATQPSTQPSTNKFDWGAGSSTTPPNASQTDRWLSRGTSGTTGNKTESQTEAGDLTGENQKFGIYYNWYTATAGSGNYSISEAGVEVTNSICPSGWVLPRGPEMTVPSPAKTWLNLIRDTYHVISTQGWQTQLSDGNLNAVNDLFAFPFNLAASGYIYFANGESGAQGRGSSMWSASSVNQDKASYSTFSPDRVTVVPAGNDAYRLNGNMIRCVSK